MKCARGLSKYGWGANAGLFGGELRGLVVHKGLMDPSLIFWDPEMARVRAEMLRVGAELP
ncbi:hypothetical protein M3936_22275 [Sutcliffiella horikoshii]|uniref:hypothetical protein n=1 Tax=Sutcliffiella horikoshii TaxID=79883 RepID=UPI00203F4903|nr:hypothetical protein [Sutcliffiella horikoshii]MCM3620289.1 hypothetical protein [Sutcliffiella horikoshii]